MNQNRQKSGFSRLLYCFIPILIYLAVSFVVSAVFEMILAVQFMANDPNLAVEDLLNKILYATLAQNSKLMIFISVISLLITGILFYKNEYRNFDRQFQNKIKPSHYAWLIGLSIGIFIAVSILIQIWHSLTTNTLLFDSYSQTMELLLQDKWWINVIAVGILAPISEEVIFRGLVFNRMRTFMSENHAIVMSALIFGLMHTPTVIQIVYAFLLGCVLAYAYSKFENILAPITIHMVFNLSNFPFMTNALSNFPSTIAQSLIFYGTCVLLCTFGIRMLVKKSKPSLKL